MSDNSTIEWTDATWPVVTGCDHISPGCENCYAAKLTSGRLKHLPAYEGLAENGRFNGKVRLLEDRLGWPLKWRKPRKIFVSDMADLFHQDVPDDYIARVFGIMAATPRHTFQVLTKRHGRMKALLNSVEFRRDVYEHAWPYDQGAGYDPYRYAQPGDIPTEYERRAYPVDDSDWWPLWNVWLGVSVEDQKWADIRIPALLETRAAVRFLSCEPLLGPIDLSPWLQKETICGCPPESRGRHLPSGGGGRVNDRLVGTDLASGCTPLGSLDVGGQDDLVLAAPSGEQHGEVPASEGDVRRGSCACAGSPAGLATPERINPAWAHRESQEREMGGQPSSELGACDSCGADTACAGGSSTGATGSVRLAQFNVEADNGAGTGDLFSEGGRRAAHGPRCGVRSGAADDLQDCPRRTAISWLIAGGESGPGSRPMHPDWARTLRDQCQKAAVPFFFKQFGEYAPVLDQPRDGDVWVSIDGPARPWQHGGAHIRRGVAEFRQGFPGAESALVRKVGKKAAGRELDGREWSEFPATPTQTPENR